MLSAPYVLCPDWADNRRHQPRGAALLTSAAVVILPDSRGFWRILCTAVLSGFVQKSAQRGTTS